MTTATQAPFQQSFYSRGSLYGANLVAAEFDDSQIVIWGPRGCSSQILESQYAQRQECHFRHYLVSQAEMVTNGLAALKRSLLPHISAYAVKGPLFLLLGDAPRLTSEDIEGFVDNSLPAGFPIVYVETGFRGGYYEGINQALYKVVKRLCVEKRPKDARLVNLIPDVGTSPQWRANAEELARILRECGIEVNVFPNRNEVPHVARLAEAAATILVNPAIGSKAAELLEERFGIPVVAPRDMPIGLMGTELWLKEVVGATGLAADETLQSIVDQETVSFFLQMKPALRDDNYKSKVDVLKSSRFVVCDELARAGQWSRLLRNELEMPGGYVFPTERGERSGGEAMDGVELLEDGESLLARCEDADVALVLGSDWLVELARRKTHNLVCVTNPVVKKITLVPKPYYGFRGALHFLEDVLNAVAY